MKKFVKLIAFALVLLLALGSVACSNDEKADKKSSSQSETNKKKDKKSYKKGSLQSETNKKRDKKSDKVLTMATNAEFPPFEYLENGEIVGADIEMAYAIAEKLGMKLKISNMDFDAVVAGPATGKYDIAISGITVNDERRKNMNFTDPYYVVSQAIIVMEGSDIEVPADLEGKTISCQEGTTGEQYILDNGYDVWSFKTGADAIAALIAGKADAVVIDEAVARALSAENAGTVVLEEALLREEYAIALTLGNDELTEKINKAIRELKKEGRLKKIFEKYDLKRYF